MTATPEQVARDFWAARARNDRQATTALLAGDVTWQVVGRTHPCARTYHGPEGFLDELGAQLGAAFVPGTRSLTVISVIADESRVVTELHETVDAVTGHHVVLDIVTVMQVANGQITACREYMDLAEVRAAIP